MRCAVPVMQVKDRFEFPLELDLYPYTVEAADEAEGRVRVPPSPPALLLPVLPAANAVQKRVPCSFKPGSPLATALGCAVMP